MPRPTLPFNEENTFKLDGIPVKKTTVMSDDDDVTGEEMEDIEQENDSDSDDPWNNLTELSAEELEKMARENEQTTSDGKDPWEN